MAERWHGIDAYNAGSRGYFRRLTALDAGIAAAAGHDAAAATESAANGIDLLT